MSLDIDILKTLIDLKDDPNAEKVDHLTLLDKLYSEYSDEKDLEPLIHFYLNGFDDLPTLKEKHLWNEAKFHKLRKSFYGNHHQLVDIVELIIKNSNCSLNSNGKNLTKEEFFEHVNNGIILFEDGELNMDLSNEKVSGIIFMNCFIASDFRNANLKDSKFIKCNLKTSDFRNADLSNGLMYNVSLEGTKFKGAKTNRFIFTNNSAYSSEFEQSDFDDWIKTID